MSEHKKLARLAIRAFYRHSSAKERLARTGNAKYDNSKIAEVLVDALTRRTWVKEDDLSVAVHLSAKQVRKALLYLEEQRFVTRAHVKEKDKDREERTRARAIENGVDEHVINERVKAIDKKIVTYVCLNYSRIVDVLNLRVGTARKYLTHLAEKGPVSVLFKCVSDVEICGKRYSSLDAARLMDPMTGQFKCSICSAEVIQCGDGSDGSAPEPRTREARRAVLDTFSTQVTSIQKQLDKVKGSVPPQYGTLNEYTRARKKALDRNAGGGGNFGNFGNRGGLGVQLDSLEDTTFEVTLGLTEEQEAAAEAELHAPKVAPDWITKNTFAKEDEAAGEGGGGEKKTSKDSNDLSLQKAAEERIKEEWLRAYLGALKKGNDITAGEGEDKDTEKLPMGKQSEAPDTNLVTDDLVAEAMAGGVVEEDWEDA